jgi:hypothetical protein
MKKIIFATACLSIAALQAKQPDILPEGYAVQTIATPKDSKGEPLYFDIGGIDFAKDGTAFIASRLHGIWTLKGETWNQFAEGLHDPQGIQLLDPEGKSILVAQKPELTKLTDTDGDGKADIVSSLSAEWRYAGNYCEYVHGPAIDRDGNAYLSLNLSHISSKMAKEIPHLRTGQYMGTTMGYDGWVLRVTPEGELSPFASGMRSAAGIGMSPGNELFVSDNQGEWVPTSCLYHVEEGKFYSHPSSLLDLEEYRVGAKKDIIYDAEHLKTKRTLPAIWMPHGELMTSPSNPVWDISEGKFGPFKGQIFMGCQTLSTIVRATLQEVDGAYQGAVFKFVDHLQSGCIRLDFAPDGSLWVGQTGRGWASRGSEEYGLQKITWDQQSVPFELKDIKLTKSGFKIFFTEPADLEKISADDITVSHWTYEYWEKYGAPKKDVQEVKASISEKSADGRWLTISVPLVKERVYGISINVKSRAGKSPSTNKGYYTLNRLISP